MIQEAVESIFYPFDGEELLEGIIATATQKSKYLESYSNHCKQKLKECYPTTKDEEIKIIDALGLQAQVNGRTDHPEVDFVKYTCSEIKDKGIWKDGIADEDELIDIADAYEFSQLPIPLIRWGCENGLIKKARKRGSLWFLSKSMFQDFLGNHIAGTLTADVWEIRQENKSVTLTGVDYRMFFNQKTCDIAKTGLKVLIVTEYLPRIQPWSNSNCFLLLTVGETAGIKVTITLFEDVQKWDHGKYLFREYCEQIKRFVAQQGGVAQKHSDALSIEFHHIMQMDETLQNILDRTWNTFSHCSEDTEIILKGGPEWSDDFLIHEKPFCELLEKLLHEMKFQDVDNKHGYWEFGKDFTFTEVTDFGLHRYYAIQAKAGNISGAVNPQTYTKTDGKKTKVTALEEIFAQLDDAFAVPYRYKETSELRYISTFIIAISGTLTDNAQEKMYWKLQRAGRLGMIYVWDHRKIKQMIRTYWLKERETSEQQQWWIANDLLAFKDKTKE